MRIQKIAILQIGLATLASIAALLISFYLTSPKQAVYIIKHYGLWLTLGTVLVFIFELRNPIKHLGLAEIKSALKRHGPALLLILFATGYLHLHVDRGFKILYDEYTLNSTAMNFYTDGHALVQAASHQMDGEVIAKAGFVDKRPCLFPFCVAVLHQLTGYRPSNAFWLNSGLTALLLTLLYLIVYRTCDKKYAYLSILLFTSLPLLAQNSTGGGYELLNLCLIASLVLAGMRYLKSNGTEGLNLVTIIAVLLASTRYESILYTLVPVVLCGIKCLQQKQIRLTWFTSISPIALIPPLLSYAIFTSNERFIQTTNENFFSIAHLATNLKAATRYLFDLQGDFSNSALLSLVGVSALLILAVFIIRKFNLSHISRGYLTPLLAVFAIVALNTFLALTCYWGAWTDPMTARFSLPLQLFFAIAPALALYHCFKIRKLPIWPSIACIVFTVTVSSSTSIRINNETRLLITSGNHWALNWITQNVPTNKSLIISDGAIGIQLYDFPAIPITVANNMPERVLHLLDINFYDQIYVVESLVDFGDAYETMPPLGANRLSKRFALTHFAQKAFSRNSFYRISQITALHKAGPGNATLQQNLPPIGELPQDDPEAAKLYLKQALPLIPQT